MFSGWICVELSSEIGTTWAELSLVDFCKGRVVLGRLVFGPSCPGPTCLWTQLSVIHFRLHVYLLINGFIIYKVMKYRELLNIYYIQSNEI